MVSKLASGLVGSEIIKIAGEVNERIKRGEKIHNLTIGDFDPNLFPIPSELKDSIMKYIYQNQTNYPPADGVLKLRTSVRNFIMRKFNLDYDESEILIAGGARPLIYSIYRTILDEGDKVIFAAPSWNNNHYSYLTSANSIIIEGKPENKFMLSADDIKPHISEVSLIALCSPQNPTGTKISKEGLLEICQLVVEENKKRTGKPVYLMYDQIYSELIFEGEHYNPVDLLPEMKKWTIYVDGVSKSLSATGIRVGWSWGPKEVISKMKSILGHVGAWAPKAEQLATSDFIDDVKSYESFISYQRNKVKNKLTKLYNGFSELKSDGYRVDVINPEGAIYLTVKFDLLGTITESGKILKTGNDITMYLIENAGVAIIPFSAFGNSNDSNWFRISVGTLPDESIDDIFIKLRDSLSKLQYEIVNV
jgi:aspartate aminotransferase